MYKKQKKNHGKLYFVCAFFGCIAFLMAIRGFAPQWLGIDSKETKSKPIQVRTKDSIDLHREKIEALMMAPRNKIFISPEADNGKRSKLINVPGYEKTFADLNDVQLATAQRIGVPPIADRNEANRNKKRLVYVCASPYYYVQPLHQSIPYLVPCAARLLEHIGHTFIDSLAVKGIPFHKIIVSSILRSEADVASLRNFNQNASNQSCHRYGTTFDVCYNRYITIEDPEGKKRHQVRNDTLKWVLAQVLRDQQKLGTCYVKYEVHQGCFHITVR